MSVSFKNAYFIKLGTKGVWEPECIAGGYLRFGYDQNPIDLARAANWQAVEDFWFDFRKNDRGTARRDTNQIRIFFEANDSDVFITFHNQLLHWCRPTGDVEVLPDGGHKRETVDGWKAESAGGKPLTKEVLSGHLLKVEMFRGTICRVAASDYLHRRLNDVTSPEVQLAEEAEAMLVSAIIGMMRQLTWQDFELLVDLVFAASGWRRIGVTGRTQKAIDLELVLPTTGQRAFVQTKSSANSAALNDYAKRFEDAAIYDRMFFVWHTGKLDEGDSNDAITRLGPSKFARLVLLAGLSPWLREKVS